jgi:hypothetical protein
MTVLGGFGPVEAVDVVNDPSDLVAQSFLAAFR